MATTQRREIKTTPRSRYQSCGDPILSELGLKEMVQRYLDEPEWTFDVETYGTREKRFEKDKPGLDSLTNEVFWISFSGPGRCDVLPLGHPKEVGGPSDQLSRSVAFKILEPLFFSEARKIGHNVKFDVMSTAKYYDGTPLPPPYGDTAIAQHILNENLGPKGYNLEALVGRHFGFNYEKIAKRGLIETFPYLDVARYSYLDSKFAWLLWRKFKKLLNDHRLGGVFRMEMDVLKVVIAMEMHGAPCSIDVLEAVGRDLEKRKTEIEYRLWAANDNTPFNLNAAAAKGKFVYKTLGFKPTHFTEKTGAPSTAANHLAAFAKKDPRVKDMVEWGQLDKLYGTYVKGLIPKIDPATGMLHTDFRQTGTVTGRFSCVSGSTLLPTSRGTFRFDEYMPVEGDLVRTHTGAMRPVLRKIYKGLDLMYRVCLSTGASIECTGEHRVLTPRGWRKVEDLTVGGTVYSYVGVEGVHESEEQRRLGDRGVLRSGQANHDASSVAAGHHVPERPAHHQDTPDQGEAEGGTRPSVFTSPGGLIQHDDRQEWFPTPWVQGPHSRWSRVPATQGGLDLCVGAPCRDGEDVGAEDSARTLGGSPHRLGQVEQLTGQPRIGDEERAQAPARQVARIEAISPLGAMGVWDIEVAGDHSYLTQGFYNHNSAEPNLQNIPSRSDDGKEIRRAFVAPPGFLLIVADYSQIELRMLAHFSQDANLIAGYVAGLDLHTLTASKAYHVAPGEVTPLQRSLGKNVNFSVCFGVTPRTLVEKYSVPNEKEGQALIDGFYAAYPKVQPWMDRILREARQQRPPHVTTLMGRKRRLGALMSTRYGDRMGAERQAINTVIQGSAADLNKVAMVRLNAMALPEQKLILSVHDELVSLVPEKIAEEAAAIQKEAMEGAYQLNGLDLVADVKIVASWAEAK